MVILFKMNKYKVTFHLMKDPTKGDDTFPKSYTVEAENERAAEKAAEKLLDAEPPEISKRSIFSQKVRKIEE